MSMEQLVFIDAETTGLYPWVGHEIWEFALIDGDTGRELEFFVQHNAGFADPISLNMNHYHDRWHDRGIEEAVGRKGFAQILEEWVRGKHLVGAVPAFDERFLHPLFRDVGVPATWHYHTIDVEALAVGWLHAVGEKVPVPWKSDDLSRLLGVEPPGPEERHTAMGDARWAKRIYEKVTG